MELEKLAITEETKGFSPLTQRMLLGLPVLGFCNSLRQKKYVQAAVYASVVAAYGLARSIRHNNDRNNLRENGEAYLDRLRDLGM